jgi:hypothetical protein
MVLLENLRSRDWATRYGSWDQLFLGDQFYKELLTLDPKDVQPVMALVNQCYTEAMPADRPSDWEWTTAQALMACAGAAYLQAENLEDIQELFCLIDPTFEVKDRIVTSDWKAFLEQTVQRCIWPTHLSAAWAWDVINDFWKTPKPIKDSENITVLLIEQKLGITGKLILERTDPGSGILYPDPKTMSFVSISETFQKATQNAVGFARGEKLWKSTEDIRWRIIRNDANQIRKLEGESLGGAFAMGLAKLMSK